MYREFRTAKARGLPQQPPVRIRRGPANLVLPSRLLTVAQVGTTTAFAIHPIVLGPPSALGTRELESSPPAPTGRRTWLGALVDPSLRTPVWRQLRTAQATTAAGITEADLQLRNLCSNREVLASDRGALSFTTNIHRDSLRYVARDDWSQ